MSDRGWFDLVDRWVDCFMLGLLGGLVCLVWGVALYVVRAALLG